MSVYEQHINEAKNILETTPIELLYPNDILNLINGCPKLIKYIPRECMDESLAVCIVDINGNYIKYLPDEYASSERVMKVAINKYPGAFYSIKKEHLTYEVCEYAVNLDYRIENNIPQEYKTEEMRKIAAKRNEPVDINHFTIEPRIRITDFMPRYDRRQECRDAIKRIDDILNNQ